jgi:hypothetical protein
LGYNHRFFYRQIRIAFAAPAPPAVTDAISTTSTPPRYPRLLRFFSDTEHEVEAFRKRTGRIIKLITVQDILDEQLAQKM